MTTKEQLLTLLEAARAAAQADAGRAQEGAAWLSGEKLAARLGLSRTAVWKAVQALQQEGFAIESSRRLGYRLAPDADALSVPAIRAQLGEAAGALQLQLHRQLESTNLTARQLAAGGAPAGLVVLADRQCAGRGRLGRSFFSPAGCGLYMSIVLRPTIEASQAVLLTTAAAVAVCEAVEALTGQSPQIKWVNDVFLHGKKICGILTEAAFGAENDRLEYAVAGIGINVHTPPDGWPPELADIVGAVLPPVRGTGGADETGTPADKTAATPSTVPADGGLPAPGDIPPGGIRSRLAGEVLRRFWQYSQQLEQRAFLEGYRRRSLVVGKRIDILRGEQRTPALALGIDDDCRLLVRTGDGRELALSSGEISVRLQA